MVMLTWMKFLNGCCVSFRMEIEATKVENFKSIDETDWVEVEDVSCFIGANEAGKTAFLEAIHKINPVEGSENYDPLMEYPRRDYREYDEYEHEDNPARVASIRYGLSSSDKSRISDEFGYNLTIGDTLEVTKNYKNQYSWTFQTDTQEFIEDFLDSYDLHHETKEMLLGSDDIHEFINSLRSSDSDDANQVLEDFQNEFPNGFHDYIGESIIKDLLPETLYFDNYYTLEGDVTIDQLVNRQNSGDLSNADQTFLSLVSMAGLDLDDFRQEDEYERIKVELEAVSLDITGEIFDYWSQGSELQVEFDNEKLDNGNVVLHIRVKNPRTGASIPFDERSRGFKWFFSFLAYFSQFERRDNDLVLLLDEPGLNLHAAAQSDLLKFINERLSPNQQIFYTTHSPFMLEPRKLERAKLVEYEEETGTKVSEDILATEDSTTFPLQASLGFDLIDTLLIGPDCLLVEGKSDMIYLQMMSDILEQEDREILSPRWTVVPVDGADNAPTFVSLFGSSDINISVLLDDEGPISQRMDDLESRSFITNNKIRVITDYVSQTHADTEDLFEEGFYLDLVNTAYLYEIRGTQGISHPLELSDFQSQQPRVAKRVEDFFEDNNVNDGIFNHTKPAIAFQQNKDDFIDHVSDDTKNKFEELFEDINSLLD